MLIKNQRLMSKRVNKEIGPASCGFDEGIADWGQMDEKTMSSYRAFFVMFQDSYDLLFKIPGCSTMKVFLLITKMLTRGGCMVSIGEFERAQMREAVGISRVSLYSCMKTLRECEIVVPMCLVRTSTGELHMSRTNFMVNPYVVWKGNVRDANQACELFRENLALCKSIEGDGE